MDVCLIGEVVREAACGVDEMEREEAVESGGLGGMDQCLVL